MNKFLWFLPLQPLFQTRERLDTKAISDAEKGRKVKNCNKID